MGVLGAGGDGFFEEHVFSVGDGFEGPLFSGDGGEGEVDGIDVWAFEEFAVACDGYGWVGEGGVGLAGVDEVGGAWEVAACDGDEACVSGVAEGVPVFASDVGGAENAPADGFG